jgi:hypothetical protein
MPPTCYTDQDCTGRCETCVDEVCTFQTDLVDACQMCPDEPFGINNVDTSCGEVDCGVCITGDCITVCGGKNLCIDMVQPWKERLAELRAAF